MSTPISLDEKFPQIEDITVTLEEGPLGSPHKDVRILSKHQLPPSNISCNSSVCNRGGIPVEDIFWHKLSDMVRNEQAEANFYGTCQGYESMGRGQKRRCLVTTVS